MGQPQPKKRNETKMHHAMVQLVETSRRKPGRKPRNNISQGQKMATGSLDSSQSSTQNCTGLKRQVEFVLLFELLGMRTMIINHPNWKNVGFFSLLIMPTDSERPWAGRKTRQVWPFWVGDPPDTFKGSATLNWRYQVGSRWIFITGALRWAASAKKNSCQARHRRSCAWLLQSLVVGESHGRASLEIFMRCSLWEPYWRTSSLSSMSFLDPKCLLLKHSSTCKKTKTTNKNYSNVGLLPRKAALASLARPCPLRPWGKGRTFFFLVAPHFEDVFCNRLPHLRSQHRERIFPSISW